MTGVPVRRFAPTPSLQDASGLAALFGRILHPARSAATNVSRSLYKSRRSAYRVMSVAGQRPAEQRGRAGATKRENDRLRREIAERDRQIAEQAKQIAEAEKRIADLERQLALRQQNS